MESKIQVKQLEKKVVWSDWEKSDDDDRVKQECQEVRKKHGKRKANGWSLMIKLDEKGES